MNLNFDEQILEAAKSIAAATAALVKSASAAQRELVAQGKVSNSHVLHFIDKSRFLTPYFYIKTYSATCLQQPLIGWHKSGRFREGKCIVKLHFGDTENWLL